MRSASPCAQGSTGFCTRARCPATDTLSRPSMGPGASSGPREHKEDRGWRQQGQNPPPPQSPGELPPAWCPAEANEAPPTLSRHRPGPRRPPPTGQALAEPRAPPVRPPQKPPKVPEPRDRGAKWPRVPDPPGARPSPTPPAPPHPAPRP